VRSQLSVVDEHNTKTDKTEANPSLQESDVETDADNENIGTRPTPLDYHNGNQMPDTRTPLRWRRSGKDALFGTACQTRHRLLLKLWAMSAI
jgi:hypothetical protein